MKTVTVEIQFSQDKINALKMYLKKLNLSLENELCKSLEKMYCEYTPKDVQEFIELCEKAAQSQKNSSKRTYKKRNSKTDAVVQNKATAGPVSDFKQNGGKV